MHGLSAVTFPQDLTDRRHWDVGVDQMLKNEEAVFSTRRKSIRGAVSILQQKIVQLEKQVEGEKAQLQANEKQMKIAREELGVLQKLFDKGYVERSDEHPSDLQSLMRISYARF